jgi:hypothetical protein
MTWSRLRSVISILLPALLVNGCARRQGADVQIALIEHCQDARDQGVALWPTNRDEAISRWVKAVLRAGNLCVSDLNEALLRQDEASHLLAFEVIVRTNQRDQVASLISYVGSERLLPEQRARVVAALKALTSQDFGDDRAAWETWSRSRR